MIRVHITATHEHIDEVLERLCFPPKEEMEIYHRTPTHVTVTVTSDEYEFTWSDVLHFGLSYIDGKLPPTGTPPFHIDIEDDDFDGPTHHGLVWANDKKAGAPLDYWDDPLVSCFLRDRELCYSEVDAARAKAYLIAVLDGGFHDAIHGRVNTKET